MPTSDNPHSAPARLYSVAEGEPWEREVRDCLADQAAGVRHAGADVAGVAIARARRIRRRRSVAGGIAVLVATVVATGALLFNWQGTTSPKLGPVGLFGDPVTTSPTPPPAPARLAHDRQLAADLPVDVVGNSADGGAVLAVGDGEAIDLGPVRQVVSAHRVGDGWAVVSGEPGTARLWWISTEHEPVSVLSGMDAITVHQGRVAYRRGAMLTAAVLSGSGELAGRVSTSAPEEGGKPVGFAGDMVVLARDDPAGWDTWHPASGDYRPGWSETVARVYETGTDQDAVGLVPAWPGSDQLCLARLDLARGLAPAQTSCVAGSLSPDAPAAVSPDGRWLVATLDQPGAEDTGAVVLVDLAKAFAEDPAAVTKISEAPAPAGTPVWLGTGTVLYPTVDELVRIVPERLSAEGAESSGAIQRAPRTGASLLLVEPA